MSSTYANCCTPSIESVVGSDRRVNRRMVTTPRPSRPRPKTNHPCRATYAKYIAILLLATMQSVSTIPLSFPVSHMRVLIRIAQWRAILEKFVVIKPRQAKPSGAAKGPWPPRAPTAPYYHILRNSKAQTSSRVIEGVPLMSLSVALMSVQGMSLVMSQRSGQTCSMHAGEIKARALGMILPAPALTSGWSQSCPKH